MAFSYTEGLLTSVKDAATTVPYATSITYHSNQTISQVAHANGVTDVIGIDPNAQKRPGSILARNAAGTNLWNARAYTYDGTGNVKSIGGSGFAYDPASRLITANLWNGTGAIGTPLKTQSHVYDLFGNLQNITGDGGRTTPTNSATNRLSGPGMFYDVAWNQTNSPGTIYEYDPFHLMWRFQSGAEDWRYVYTADDERIWSFKSGGGSRWTLRDLGNNVLREYANNSGVWSVKEDFIHRGGQLLAADTAEGVSHFHLDHLGTPRLITNQSGVKTAYHVYWPYGEELTSATQDAERMKFTGHERDLNGAGGVGDDLDYMHARFCSPVTGRFLGVDAVGGSPGTPQSWNRYAYSLGNPVKYLDPNGKDEVEALSQAYTATSSAIIGFGSAIQDVGDNLNQGGALGIAADTALGTVGSAVQGFGDLFNLGTSSGEAIGSGGDSYDVGNALAADMGRAGGLALMLAGPAVRVGGTTPLFRAVTPAETTSLAETGAFSPSPTGSMSKGFFFSKADAEAFASQMSRIDGPHTVVAAEAPKGLVKSSPPHSVAGEGPGVYIPNHRLSSVKSKVSPR